MDYTSLSKEEIERLLSEQNRVLKEIGKKKIALDISRGKPAPMQLDGVMPLLDILGSDTVFPKPDYRNYGILEGIPELRALFAQILGVDKNEVIIGGNSSLNMMYDTIARAMQFGICGGQPWFGRKIKFLTPVPGYDRHFGICEHFGIEMINIPMTPTGPNMDLVEQLVSGDDDIKGIWCVPKYQNPTGITFSEDTVRRLATMKTAEDFRIFWDNAYVVHDLYEDGDTLANIMSIAQEAGTQDRIYQFTSTSKVTFPGAGVACLAASEKNIKDILSHMKYQTIGANKINQYAHLLYLKSAEHVKELMAAHAAIIRPKFDKFMEVMDEAFGDDSGIASWTRPKGGYFISLDVLEGCAKEVGRLCKSVGLTITNVGDTYPYGMDDKDSNIRIAPTFTSDEDLEAALQILVCCIKVACLTKLSSK